MCSASSLGILFAELMRSMLFAVAVLVHGASGRADDNGCLRASSKSGSEP